jgi:hypothetical protein
MTLGHGDGCPREVIRFSPHFDFSNDSLQRCPRAAGFLPNPVKHGASRLEESSTFLKNSA